MHVTQCTPNQLGVYRQLVLEYHNITKQIHDNNTFFVIGVLFL